MRRIESSATSWSGTGGLIGKVNGQTSVRNCGINGSVKNISTSSSENYVGGLIGYVYDKCTVSNSFTTCIVENNMVNSSSCTGGLLGKTSTYSLEVLNCYSSGNVTANKGRAGGITGYVYSSASSKHNYVNCYAAEK